MVQVDRFYPTEQLPIRLSLHRREHGYPRRDDQAGITDIDRVRARVDRERMRSEVGRDDVEVLVGVGVDLGGDTHLSSQSGCIDALDPRIERDGVRPRAYL